MSECSLDSLYTFLQIAHLQPAFHKVIDKIQLLDIELNVSKPMNGI